MRGKELEDLRPRTLSEHPKTFKYFPSFLEQKCSNIQFAEEITTEIIRDYVYYMSKEKDFGMMIILKLLANLKPIRRDYLLLQ